MFLFILLATFYSKAQTGSISGSVYNSINNEAIEFSKVQLIGEGKGAFPDSTGSYIITDIQPGIYSVKVSAIGFKDLIIDDIVISNSRSVEVNFPMEEFILEQDEVVVKANPFRKIKEAPN